MYHLAGKHGNILLARFWPFLASVNSRITKKRLTFFQHYRKEVFPTMDFVITQNDEIDGFNGHVI